MIADLFYNLAYACINGFFSALPGWNIGFPLDKVTAASSFLHRIDAFTSVSEFEWCLGATVSTNICLLALKFTIKIIDWVCMLMPL